ncbi:MAG: SprT family zinc-dependent metalloprotease [Rhodobacter sp.]|nr:SprT family zinc-dependent metalloprotease [Rhodobacter sp.]
MGRAVLSGNPPVEITLRPTARARRVSLRVSALDGRVTLSLPKGMNPDEAMAFAQEKSDWIRRHLAGRQDPVRPAIGGTVLLRGQEVTISAGAVDRAIVRDGAMLVPAAPDLVAARIKAFLRLEARASLTEAAERHAKVLGRTVGKITLRDTRSRWGSCNQRGDLMFSWRLVMAPPELLDYVAAHEVGHMVEMNHSPAYWRVVEELCPDYRARRRWLRENGTTLHRYRFDD